MKRLMAMLASAAVLSTSPGFTQSQEVTSGKPEPLFSVTTSIPDAVAGGGQLDLNLVLDRNGAIKDVLATTGSLCKPQCTTFGRPPRTICWIPVGCPGTGGGGGALLESPILIEFTPKPAPGAEPGALKGYEVVVHPITEAGVETAKAFELAVPRLAAE